MAVRRPLADVESNRGDDVALNLHKYENQAKLSVCLAAVGILAAVAAVALLLRNFEPADRFVYYSSSGKWFLALGGTLAVGLLTSTGGFFVGIASAGQRRNKAIKLSWLGFFLSAAAITLTMCCVVFFYFTRNNLG